MYQFQSCHKAGWIWINVTSVNIYMFYYQLESMELYIHQSWQEHNNSRELIILESGLQFLDFLIWNLRHATFLLCKNSCTVLNKDKYLSDIGEYYSISLRKLHMQLSMTSILLSFTSWFNRLKGTAINTLTRLVYFPSGMQQLWSGSRLSHPQSFSWESFTSLTKHLVGHKLKYQTTIMTLETFKEEECLQI
jgi:hypothetical protein